MAYRPTWANVQYQFGQVTADLTLTDDAGVRPTLRFSKAWAMPLSSFTAAFRVAAALADAQANIAAQDADAAAALAQAQAQLAFQNAVNNYLIQMLNVIASRVPDNISDLVQARMNYVQAYILGNPLPPMMHP